MNSPLRRYLQSVLPPGHEIADAEPAGADVLESLEIRDASAHVTIAACRYAGRATRSAMHPPDVPYLANAAWMDVHDSVSDCRSLLYELAPEFPGSVALANLAAQLELAGWQRIDGRLDANACLHNRAGRERGSRLVGDAQIVVVDERIR